MHRCRRVGRRNLSNSIDPTSLEASRHLAVKACLSRAGYENDGSLHFGFKRRFIVALTPVSEVAVFSPLSPTRPTSTSLMICALPYPNTKVPLSRAAPVVQCLSSNRSLPPHYHNEKSASKILPRNRLPLRRSLHELWPEHHNVQGFPGAFRIPEAAVTVPESWPDTKTGSSETLLVVPDHQKPRKLRVHCLSLGFSSVKLRQRRLGSV